MSTNYNAIVKDMQDNPAKYYDAFGGSVTKYNQELNRVSYMTTVGSYDLPEKYTRYADIYSDMSTNPQRYIDGLGGERAYKTEMTRIGELFGIEQSRTLGVINVIDDRVSNEFLQETGLDQYYTYDPTNPDDVVLQELNYAPSSFLTKSDIQKKMENTYSVEQFVPDEQTGIYLSLLYQYDETDPDDILNRAFGRMPKSFKYENDFEDQQREARGELPKAAQAWVENSEQFASDYEEYYTKMQEYKDDKYAWDSLPHTSQLITEKPIEPYLDGDIPETIQAIMGYRDELAIEEQLDEVQTAYEKFTDDGGSKVEPLPFAYNEDAPIGIDEFEVSEGYKQWHERYLDKKSAIPQYLTTIMDVVLATTSPLASVAVTQFEGELADEAYEEIYVEHLKETGEYDRIQKEWEQTQQNIKAALVSDYSPENYSLLTTNVDPVVDLGISSGFSGIEYSSDYSLMNAVYYNLAQAKGETFTPDNMGGVYAVDASQDEKISDIAKEFYDLVYDGTDFSGYMVNYNDTLRAMVDSINNGASVDEVVEKEKGPQNKGYHIDEDVLNKWESVLSDEEKLEELTGLFNQADYRIMQLASADWNVEKKELEDTTAWSYAIKEGLGSGGISHARGRVSVGAEMFNGLGEILGLDTSTFDKIIEDNAESWEGQNRLSAYRASLTDGDAGSTDFLFGVSQSVGTMAPDLAIASITPSGSASTLTGWKALGRKLIMNKNMIPFFTSSLGRNLMEGELAGKTDDEKWLQAIPAAYTETVIEQAFGMFSGKSPLGSLIRKGAGSVKSTTIKNVGRFLFEYPLGEAIEENLQDITTEFFRGAFWSDYEAQYPDAAQMWETTKMAGTVALLFAGFGMGGSISDIRVVRAAETSFNNAVDAFDRGDMATFDKEMANLKEAYSQALGDMVNAQADGSIDALLDQSNPVTYNLNAMQDAVRDAATLRVARSQGADVPQQAIEMADATANEAIARVSGNMQVMPEPTTLYDQVAQSTELTRMVHQGGFASSLISTADGVMTDEQIDVLRQASVAAAENPYINIKYADQTAGETLQKKIDSTTESLTTLKAQMTAFESAMEGTIESAYMQSKEQGKAVVRSMKSELVTLKNKIAAEEKNLVENKRTLSAFNEQTKLTAAFADAGLNTPSEPISGEGIQSQADGENSSERVTRNSGQAIAYEAGVAEIVEQSEPLSEQVGKAQGNEEGTIAEVLTSVKQTSQSAKDRIKFAYDQFKRKIVDSGASLATFAKKTKDPMLYPLYNNAKQAKFAAQYMIGGEQFDINGNRTGDSLIDTFKNVREKGDTYTNEFFSYLLHKHNIDRMAQEKPVFGESVTAEDSKIKVAEFEANHPEFEAYAQKVYAYNDNLMQWRVDSGLLSQEQADTMREMYPNYVPTYRLQASTVGASAIGSTVSISNTVKKATGSNLDIMQIDDSMARQTLQVLQAAKRNIVGLRLFNNVIEHGADISEYASVNNVTVEHSDYDIDAETDTANELKNTIKIYSNGEVATMKVSAGIFDGFRAISYEAKEYMAIIRGLQHGLSTFKKLITGYNPVFTARNFFRDLQDAGLYTKYPGRFAKNFPVAYKEMITNGEYWQMYQRLGGTGSSFFDYERGLATEKKSKAKQVASTAAKYSVGVIENINMAIEQAPRLTEFISTLEAEGTTYESKMQALYNSAEVTVNFGRSGSWGKVINSTFVPFFNPAIQGSSRLIRRFADTKGVKGWTSLVIRSVALGVIPSLINGLVYDDDDEYEKISNRDKDRYYLFKMGDGYWAKIPKGRVLSLFGSVTQMAAGTSDTDAAEFLQLVKEQVAPISPFESNIAQPLIDAANNSTWYDTPIESQRLQAYAPGQRFDESTDAFSKWLGKATNFSPKKINYILDQYTGVIGDFLLPATTPRAEKDPFTKAFVLDTVTTNNISAKFYDAVEEIGYRKNSEDPQEAAKAKAENTVIQRYVRDISEFYKLIRKVENSDATDEEKMARVRDLKVTIGAMQQEALSRLE